MRIQEQRSYIYFGSGGFPLGTGLARTPHFGFPVMGTLTVRFPHSQIPCRPHYRERSLRLLRTHVTKTGNLSVENFFARQQRELQRAGMDGSPAP
jgi:hypothetical protein